MDMDDSPHSGPNSDGGQLIGEDIAHAVCREEGLAGALSGECMPIAVRRVSATRVILTFNIPLVAPTSILVTGNGGAPEGIFFAATEPAIARINAATHTIAISAANEVTIDINAGVIPAGYWNANVGAVVQKTVGNRAAQAAILANTLFYNCGGRSDPTRPGIGINANPVNLFCA